MFNPPVAKSFMHGNNCCPNFSIDEADILMAAVNYILSLTSQLQTKLRWSGQGGSNTRHNSSAGS